MIRRNLRIDYMKLGSRGLWDEEVRQIDCGAEVRSAMMEEDVLIFFTYMLR